MTQRIMAANRWKSLDYERPAGGRDSKAGSCEAEAAVGDSRPAAPRLQLAPPADPWREPLVGVVAQARGAYLIRNYSVAVDLLEPRLREQPDLEGGQRILGLALGRLHHELESMERLRESVRQSQEDWLARAALASLLLRGDHARLAVAGYRPGIPSSGSCGAPDGSPHAPTGVLEAITLLREALSIALLPAVSELLGAARWRAGQDALRERRFRLAARLFGAAAADFSAAARKTGAARAALSLRQSTTFVGEAVALLCAGELETAQRLFSRSPVLGLSAAEPLSRFAARLFEFSGELGRLPPPDRSEAVAALREMVLAVRLEVGFYDGRQPVCVAWTGGPD